MSILEKLQQAMRSDGGAHPPPPSEPMLPKELIHFEKDPFWVVALDEVGPTKAVLVHSPLQAVLACWPKTFSEDRTKSMLGFGVPPPFTHFRREDGVHIGSVRYTSKDKVHLSGGAVDQGHTRETLESFDLQTTAGGYDPSLEPLLDEAVERHRLLNSNSGDYEGILRRVEALLGERVDTGPRCEVCQAVWQNRRVGPARSRLMHHLAHGGHVALEAGVEPNKLIGALAMRARGMGPAAASPVAAPERDGVLEHARGLVVISRLVAQRPTLAAAGRARDAAGAFAELAKDLGREDAAALAEQSVAHLSKTLQALIDSPIELGEKP